MIKNAIDWASRPAFESPLKHKPVALMSASMSPVGGVRAQAQLKPVLSGTLSVLYPAIEMSVPTAQKVFDADGRCLDDATSERLTRFIEGYVAWVRQQA